MKSKGQREKAKNNGRKKKGQKKRLMYTKTQQKQPVCWGEKPYHSLDYDAKQLFGEKVYRILLNGGMTCPNRDGTLGEKGCIFCSGKVSGDFAQAATQSISQQLALGKQQLQEKRPVSAFIAYFQAFTNTYGPLSKLRSLYTEAIADAAVKILSVATRPDCLAENVLKLLSEINQQKPVWVELGLQTIHQDTARFIRRGYSLSVFEEAVSNLRKRNLTVIVHIILGLPGETLSQMLETIDYINQLDIQGVKLQLLHVLKGTDLADLYEAQPFYLPTMDEYIYWLGRCIGRLQPRITIHRLTGDGPKELLIAPLWTTQKRTVLNRLHSYLKQENIWQGKELP